jgi:hypothetical protein
MGVVNWRNSNQFRVIVLVEGAQQYFGTYDTKEEADDINLLVTGMVKDGFDISEIKDRVDGTGLNNPSISIPAKEHSVELHKE